MPGSTPKQTIDWPGAVINADLLVIFGAARALAPAPLGRPAVLTRWLMLKTPSLQGDEVKALQRPLVNDGATIAIDGDFGPMASAAVSAYQAAHDLEVDGVVGLQAAKASGLQGV